jgi:dienelactone hydrolase
LAARNNVVGYQLWEVDAMNRVYWMIGFWLFLSSQVRAECPAVELEDPGPLPLLELLVDYLPVDPVFGKGLKKVTVCDQLSWDRKRLSVLRRVERMLGQAPAISEPLLPETLETISRGSFSQKKILFESGTGDKITGYLLIPESKMPLNGYPAVLALHSTIAPGSAVTVGVERARENRYYGEELAERGYVVLAVDTIAAGERVRQGDEPFVTKSFDEDYPRWSAMGKMLHDHRRAVDYLCSLSQVDAGRIGALGHSLGGYNAFYLQAFDQRIRAAVSSCGFTPMGGTTSPFQFARDQWFVHFPELRDYLRAGTVPFDLHEVMALCAPRPLFNYSAKQDHIFPSWAAVDKALNQVGALYDLLGVGSLFQRVDGEGDHDFPPEVREQAYRFLDRFLVYR